MRAIRQHRFGGPDELVLQTVPDPEPATGQVRIRVTTAGLHLIDTTIRAGEEFGTMPRPDLPMTPGREVAGIVDAVGPDVGQRWIGRRVVAHLGTLNGGYAELALADASRLHEIAGRLAELDDRTAVAAIGTGRTAAGILDLARLTADDIVLVTSAAGGLGVLLVQAGRAAGARTYGVASGGKLDVVRRFGADLALDRADPDWPHQLPEPPSVVFDGVGGEVGRAAYEALRPGGRLVRYGWSSGEQNSYADPRREVVDVLGPAMLARPGGIAALEAEALARAADGTRVPLVGSVYSLDRAADAHRALESGATTGKAVLVIGGPQ